MTFTVLFFILLYVKLEALKWIIIQKIVMRIKQNITNIKYVYIILIFLMFFVFLGFTFWLMVQSGEKEIVKIISDTISNIFKNNAFKVSFLINILLSLSIFIDIGSLFKNRD